MIIRITAAAEQDLEEAFDWYASQQTTAAADFLDKYRDALRSLAEAPNRWPAHPYVAGMRRLRIDPSPYAIVYLVRPTHCTIYAIEDLRRKPGYWRRR
jgi:plasmid stabilization system protein ParE